MTDSSTVIEMAAKTAGVSVQEWVLKTVRDELNSLRFVKLKLQPLQTLE